MATPDDIMDEEEEEEAEESVGPCGGSIDRYDIFYRLGRGGMASVYLGRLRGKGHFEHWVAVKQIHEHLADKARFRDMFLDEAQVAAQLAHPNLVQVMDVGEERGRPFLVMEFVNGETLGHLILRTFKRGRRVPLHIAVRIMAWACEGLHHAHQLRDSDGQPRGLVHRDISPHNILVSYDGIVKVTDFGIVKAAGRNTQTRTGVIKGKPQYMSPEQILAKPIDQRADIFAMGIVLFETCLMKRLFKDVSDFAGLQRIVKGQIPHPSAIRPDFPPTLERVIMKALRVDPDERYQTARDLQVDLERYLLEVGEPVGTADIADYMELIFDERIKGRAELISWIREKGGPIPETHEPSDDIPSNPSSSLPAPNVTGQDTASEILRAQVAGIPKWTILVMAIALLLAVASGFWVARTIVVDDEDAEELTGMQLIEGPLTTSPETSTPVKTLPGPGVDVGATASNVVTKEPVVEMVWGADAGHSDDNTPPETDGGTLVFGADAEPTPNPTPTKPPRRPIKRPPPVAGPPGTISVMANPWSEVYHRGRKLGRTPLMRVSIPSGRQVLTILPRGKRPGVRRTIRVRPNGHTPVSVDLR